MRNLPAPLFSPALVLCASACSSTVLQPSSDAPPLPGARRVDALIQPAETHLAGLWQLTTGGENAEGYWSFGGDRLSFQRSDEEGGYACDRIFVTTAEEVTFPVARRQVSDGRGVTTCAYFLPGDEQVIFASTAAHQESCPERPDFSQGYVWPIRPEYDLYVHDLASGTTRSFDSQWGYDAEATVSPRGDRIVFTSTRSGDLELWTCALDGSDLVQVTDTLGYDGGAFFSHDGEDLVFRATVFDADDEAGQHARYRELLQDWTVRPHSMELFLIDADGENRRQLTRLGGANFAPFFYPDDQRVIFSTNHQDAEGRNFDLYAIGVDGQGLERITTYEGFDSFPMFSPDGRWLAFSSNRGGTRPGETNLFIARWRP